jgi:microcin C transport system substrate-binding protein
MNDTTLDMACRRALHLHFIMFLSAASLLVGCKQEKQKQNNKPDPAPVAEKTENAHVPEFVTTEGAPPITVEIDGMTWFTSEPKALGDPRAKRGGIIKSSIPAWPENLRRFGTGSNTWLNYFIRDVCYESLCGTHPQTLEVIPGLASHWYESEDHTTFRFLIDERARWSDGKPVVPEDYIATWNLLLDDTLIDPMWKQLLIKMKPPTKIGDRGIKIKVIEKDWRNFLTAQVITPLPAHELAQLEVEAKGKAYLEEYGFRLTAHSGPYTLKEGNIKDEESITLTRRTDWWAEDQVSNDGLYNFDRIQFFVVRDRRNAFDKTCKGELDFQSVNTAKWWVEDITPLEAAEKGWLVRQEIYTKFPKSIQGMAFNMRNAPLDDVRVRKALAHLYDRKKMLNKFAYDLYDRLKSYYPGSDAENHENEMVDFDVRKAVELLAEAGWNERGPDGILLKDGKRLSFTYMYRSAAFEKYLNPYQETCRRVGVELKLKKVTPETHWKSMMERSFEIAGMGWGAILYPNPKSSYRSDMADKSGSNNITGFKSAVADKLINEYDAEFDLAKRNELLKKLDAEIHNQHPYALEWYNPSERILYWNKFGMPDYGLNKYDEWEDAYISWWYDEEKANALEEAKKSGKSFPIPPLKVRSWGSGSTGANNVAAAK